MPFWRNPVAVGLLAAGIGLTGNVIATSIQSWNAHRVGKQKAQANIILEAIKTGDRDQVAKTLTFFLQLGFIDDPDGRIQSFIANLGAIPVLPGESDRDRGSEPVDMGHVEGRIVGPVSRGIQREVLHPYPAPGTLYSAWAVAQFQRQLPHRHIPPLPLLSNIVGLPTSVSANPAAQEALTEPVDVHQHALVGLFHVGHGMGFQTQLLSDKSFYEHLGSGPFVFLGRKHEINRMPGCLSNPRQAATPRT